MRKKSDRHCVAAVAMPGAPIFELAIACEVFGIDRSDLTERWYRFELAQTAHSVRLSHGLAAIQGAGLDVLDRADTIIVPACRSIHAGAPPQLLAALQRADQRGARLAAICSGAFVLAEAGLLDGRRATTHWMHAAELSRRYPDVTVDADAIYLHDHVWTSAGTTAGIDMCLEMVRHDHGSGIANAVARRLVAPPHRDGGQAQYIPEPALRRAGSSLAPLQHWARQHIVDVTVSRLAQRAGVSERTLHRQFTRYLGQTPHQWIQRERILLAQELLEVSDATVATIAARTGLGTAANLRQQFNAILGTSPARYRAAFRGIRPEAGTGA